jgi:hypothetical protein
MMTMFLSRHWIILSLFDVAAPMGRGGMRRRKGDSWRLIFPALFHLDDPELAQVAVNEFCANYAGR